MPENIITTEFSTEMQQAYINYSMSVITSRAVPDVRDGLKPVQRRVLFAMNELGLNSDKPHRKSARIVGDTMGKYHPHGDSSIYDALVVLAQDFKKGMALVDGHGNFGSIEGDGAAAMRYTEARLKKFTQEVYLADLDKNVIDFVSNFDETEKEPAVLPVRVPNVLVNGSDGIAVGMTTSIPPHNLAEVLDAEIHLIDHPKADTKELMNFVKGPDFPTGAFVTNESELLSIYETGKGKIRLRGKAEIVYAKKKSDKDRIVISEIPYTMIGANIGKFLMDVASLVETKKLTDIVDISNQSSKEGIKIVLDLKKGADAEKILQGIYKKTKLEDTFGVNMLVIADGKPETMGLKPILEHHIAFMKEVNTRKYTTLLTKELEKKEIQEGLIKAVDIIDLIIEIIRGSKDIRMAKRCLTTGEVEGIKFRHAASKKQAQKLSFTEKQATAILELRLSKLIGLEILALEEDYKKTLEKIASYEKILGSERALLRVIKADLEKIKKDYSLPRKTQIAEMEKAVFEEAPIEEVAGVFAMNRFGYVKFIDQNLFGKNEETIKEENKLVVPCTNFSRILIFTKEGLMHQINMKDLPFSKVKDKGTPLDNISNYDSTREEILFVASRESLTGLKLLFVTERGMVKRVDASEFSIQKKTVNSTKLNEGDRIAFLVPVQKRHILLMSKEQRFLRFQMNDISELKKGSVGVRGMKLDEGDSIVGCYQLNPKEDLKIKIGRKSHNLGEAKLRKRDGRPESL